MWYFFEKTLFFWRSSSWYLFFSPSGLISSLLIKPHPVCFISCYVCDVCTSHSFRPTAYIHSIMIDWDILMTHIDLYPKEITRVIFALITFFEITHRSVCEDGPRSASFGLIKRQLAWYYWVITRFNCKMNQNNVILAYFHCFWL